MAESIIIFFSSASAGCISDFICNEMSLSVVSRDFWRNADGEQYSISISPYEEILSEYEPEDIERIVAKIGHMPSTSLAIEFRRSKGNLAIDEGARIAKRLLENFSGIVDDCYSELWEYGEIVSGVEKRDGIFLEAYRCK